MSLILLLTLLGCSMLLTQQEHCKKSEGILYLIYVRVCKKNGKIILMNEGLSSIVEMHWWEKIKWGYNLLKGGYFSSRNW